MELHPEAVRAAATAARRWSGKFSCAKHWFNTGKPRLKQDTISRCLNEGSPAMAYAAVMAERCGQEFVFDYQADEAYDVLLELYCVVLGNKRTFLDDIDDGHHRSVALKFDRAAVRMANERKDS